MTYTTDPGQGMVVSGRVTAGVGRSSAARAAPRASMRMITEKATRASRGPLKASPWMQRQPHARLPKTRNGGSLTSPMASL